MSRSACFAAAIRSSIRSRRTTTLDWLVLAMTKGCEAGICVEGCVRGIYPPAVVESDVVRKMGAAESTSGGVLATGVVGFDFDLPMRKKSKKVDAAALASFCADVATCGDSDSGDGLECAGGRK